MMILLLMLLSGEADFRPHDLRDEDIVNFQRADYDKTLLANTRVIVGRHHGALVYADFPCSDVCPTYTTRIVHYDVDVGPECARLGGVERPAMVPMGVAVQRITYCVPSVLGGELITEGA